MPKAPGSGGGGGGRKAGQRDEEAEDAPEDLFEAVMADRWVVISRHFVLFGVLPFFFVFLLKPCRDP